MAHFAMLERDPRRTGAMDVLLDLRTITTTPETSQLRGVADRIAPQNTDLRYGRLAIVAVNPEAVGIGRLFVEFARGRFDATTIVETIKDGERWLETPSLASEAVRQLSRP